VLTEFTSAGQTREIFQEAFEAALADADFAAKLKEHELSLHFVHADPGYELFIGVDGVVDSAPYAPVLRFELSADTLHEILLGRLPIPRAVVDRRLVVKGGIAKIRLLAELLPVMGREYARVFASRKRAAQ
jgi:hypothetical protein